MNRILIQNGTVIDGSGAPGFVADVLIGDGRILKIGPKLGDRPDCAGAEIIDAAGKLVMPGFINMHSHADCSAAMYPNMESTLGQGVTTEFTGHCGLGVAPIKEHWLYMFPEKKAFRQVNPEPIGGINPYGAYIVPAERMRPAFERAYGQKLDWTTFGEFLDHLRRVRTGANLATVAGQAHIRLQAMGLDYKRPATEEEIRAMEDSLEEAMDGGALGLGLGLDYHPGLYASREELLRLMTLVARRGGIVTAHTRMRPNDYYQHKANVYESYREFMELGLESGARIHISHISNAFEVTPKDDAMEKKGVRRTLALLEQYREQGLSVTWDVIPYGAFGPFHYPMAASMFQPYVEQCGGVTAFAEVLKVGNYRQLIAEEIRGGNHASRGIFTRFNPKGDPEWDTRQRFTRTKDETLVGKTIREAAEGRDSLDFLLNLLAEDPQASIIQLSRRPEHTPDRDEFVEQQDATIGLDTWTFDYDACLNEEGMPLECGSPATYEGMTAFLEREKARGVSVETTVQKLTSNAARCLGLTDRGLIREGYAADLLVVDYDHFSACQCLADPRHGARGLDYVIVGGQVAVRQKIHTHVRSGRILQAEKG